MNNKLKDLYKERDRTLNAITNLHHMRAGERKDRFYSGYMNKLNKIQQQIDDLEEDRHKTIISGGEVLELGDQSRDTDEIPY